MSIEFFNTETISHSEFVQKYEVGQLKLRIDTNSAGYLFQNILSDYAGRQSTYRMLFFGGVLGGIVAIFFVGWWSLVGFFLAIVGQKLSNRHTNDSVISKALQDPVAFKMLADNRILAYET